VLAARGIDFDCFEKGSNVGGNWRYHNDNGMSSAYRSLFINTSRRMMEYASYPMSEDYPDYPHHTQIARYFDAFVDHFALRDRITFSTEVRRVEPGAGGWDVTLDNGTTRTYEAVLVANGHHWDARWPEPPFPGQESFTGEQLHSHYYREPDERFGDRNVLVLGIGNSATDIAVETSRHSRRTYLAMRRGAHVLPKYLRGKPTDELGTEFLSRLPFWFTRWAFARTLRQAQGDHGELRPAEARPQARRGAPDDLIGPASPHRPRAHQGEAEHRAHRRRDRALRRRDARCDRHHRVVHRLPDLVPVPVERRLDASDNRIALYRRVVHPDWPGLYFIGLVQPLGAIMPIAELQSEWIADVLEGKVALPDADDMKRVIEREDRRMRKRYVASKRHTIQVDFHPYMRVLRRERKRKRGLRRALAERSHELRLPAPAR
jgi:dimethylaniline monooxygenase (N-oxide forming)